MTREPMLKRIDQEWRGLVDALDAVPAARMTEAGVIDDWSARDIIAHVTCWENEFLKALPAMIQGERLPSYATLHGGIDAFNAAEREKTRAATVREVWRAAFDTHSRLLSPLKELPLRSAPVEQRLLRRLRQDTTQHYREHAEQLRAWRDGERD